MSNNKIKLLQDFQQGLKGFLEELCESFEGHSSSPSLITARILLVDQVPIEDILKVFTVGLLPSKSLLIGRDSIKINEFLLKMDLVIASFATNSVDIKISALWQSERLNSEDHDVMMDWFDFFSKCAEKYNEINHVVDV